jgi:hypothetical protein
MRHAGLSEWGKKHRRTGPRARTRSAQRPPPRPCTRSTPAAPRRPLRLSAARPRGLLSTRKGKRQGRPEQGLALQGCRRMERMPQDLPHDDEKIWLILVILHLHENIPCSETWPRCRQSSVRPLDAYAAHVHVGPSRCVRSYDCSRKLRARSSKVITTHLAGSRRPERIPVLTRLVKYLQVLSEAVVGIGALTSGS